MSDLIQTRSEAAKLVAKQRCWLAAFAHKTSKGIPLDFTRFHYLKGVYADDSPDIVLQTGVQVGKTEFVLCDAFAIISCGGDYQLVQPKDDLRYLFLGTRVSPTVEKSEYYLQNINKRSNIVRWAKQGMLRIVFSNREDEMIAFPADAVGIDELDRCNLVNLELLPDRMKGSVFRFFRRASTPTTLGTRTNHNINWYYENSDKREYHLLCQECGDLQPILWQENVVSEKRDPETGELKGTELRDVDWTPTCGRDIYVFCRKCHTPLDRTREGVWVQQVPGHDRHGYHLNKLISPLCLIKEMWGTYQASVLNPSALQAFFNSDLGLPYVGVGNNVTDDMLHSAAWDWLCGDMTRSDGPCTMGVDVGPEYLDVRVSAYKQPNTRHGVWIGKVKSFAELGPLISRFNVRMCVIDAEPETRAATEFQAKASCEVILCYLRGLDKVSGEDLTGSKIRKDKVMTIDRTLGMDAVWATFVRGENKIPRNYPDLSEGEYVTEMTTPTRVLEVRNDGKERFTWTHGTDHSFLADVFDLYAAKICGYLHRTDSNFMTAGKGAYFHVGPPKRFSGRDLRSEMA